jgi:hypothetical protein
MVQPPEPRTSKEHRLRCFTWRLEIDPPIQHNKEPTTRSIRPIDPPIQHSSGRVTPRSRRATFSRLQARCRPTPLENSVFSPSITASSASRSRNLTASARRRSPDPKNGQPSLSWLRWIAQPLHGQPVLATGPWPVRCRLIHPVDPHPTFVHGFDHGFDHGVFARAAVQTVAVFRSELRAMSCHAISGPRPSGASGRPSLRPHFKLIHKKWSKWSKIVKNGQNIPCLARSVGRAAPAALDACGSQRLGSGEAEGAERRGGGGRRG